MEKSLNSSRNFKLPPIQGAVPAANILRQPPTARQTWRPSQDQGLSSASLPNHRSPVKPPRTVIHVPKDPFPGRYRSPHVTRNLSTAATQPRRDYKATILNEKNIESKLEFAPLGHHFPQSYAVLPPIQKIKDPLASETQGKSVQDRASRGDNGNNNLTDSNKSAVDNSLRNDKQRREDMRKPPDNRKSGNSNADNSRSVVEKNASTKKKMRSESQDNETGERKPSATTQLFLKGKRKGRRVGVCLENEPALVNVTEQLKEIFLRRNMEEMYLI